MRWPLCLAFLMKSEEIEERAVLAEAINVAGIVGRRVVIAHQQYDARADSLLEQPAPLDVSLFIKKHNGVYLLLSYYLLFKLFACKYSENS